MGRTVMTPVAPPRPGRARAAPCMSWTCEPEMSVPTLQGLQTALSGLIASQEAIDTTGHNITNANTPGYSRQTAVMETNEPLPIAAMSHITGAGGQMGTGVNVDTFTRIRNTYLD